MKKYIYIVLAFLFFSCEKKVEVTPANIYGIWAHLNQSSQYYEAMRLNEDGTFQFMERYSYEREFKVLEEASKNASYTLVDKTVTIYRNKGTADEELIRAFKIKKLTNARLIEENDFQWTGF